MKVLIWVGCFFVNSLIQTLFQMRLGAIPAAMFFWSTFCIAKSFAARYDNRKNKTSKKYADSTKGLMKGFTWYGASILYIILGTIFNSLDPMSFDFVTQIIIAILCIGLAITGHVLINKKVHISYSKEAKVTAVDIKSNDTINFCRKCGAKLEGNGRFCHMCGTEIKENSNDMQ